MSRVVIEREALSRLVGRLDEAVRSIRKGHHKAGARAVAEVATELANLPDHKEASA